MSRNAKRIMVLAGCCAYVALSMLCLVQYPPLTKVNMVLIGPPSLLSWGGNGGSVFLCFSLPLAALLMHALFGSEARVISLLGAVFLWMAGGWFSTAMGI